MSIPPLFSFSFTVQEGHKRGKQLGFPTLNAPASHEIPEGIYVSQAMIAGEKYNALTFVGTAKTFNETAYLSETYLLDFSQDIYGEYVQVELLKKLRDNQKFATEEALVQQMEADKKEAELFFSQL